MEEFEIVTNEWLKNKIEEHNFSQRGFAKKLHVLETTLSRWITGTQNMSEITKVALYYYFRCLELEKRLEK
jgi:plasmid maintenance system antidote protein VapI